MNKKRLGSLRSALRKNSLDALLVTKKENVFYLSGFQGQGVLLIAPSRDNYLITDTRFAQEASEKCTGFNLELVDKPGQKLLQNLITKTKIKRLGFESKWLSHHEYGKFSNALRKTRLVPTRRIIEDLRIVKDAYELSCIKKAISITKKGFDYIKRIAKKPGMTEQGAAVEIDNFLRSAGSEKNAFETIVAGRHNSSHPHAHTSKKKLANRGPILIDMGCVYRGYHSDLTRMLFIGKIVATFRSTYRIVKEAQQKAIKKIAPGVRISEVDHTARQHIANKGFGKAFIHGLGHGIGLEIHESPGISGTSKALLKPGMVFTVEPGIYIPSWGGVRVEDIVAVTKNGCEILTKGIAK